MRKLKNSELNRKTIPEYKSSKKYPFIIILDNVRSLNNIGSIFRTCDAFLVEAIYLCGFTATPPHKDIQKTALGATESVDWFYFKSTADVIKKLNNDYFVVSVEQTENSINLNEFKIDTGKKYALIFGNEVKGVDQKIVDISSSCIEIPQLGTKHSFNIAVSTGIVLWEFYKKFRQ